MKSYMLGFYAVLLLWLLVSSSMQDDVVKGSSCLTTKDTRVPQKNLVSYTLQHKSLFPVEAVRFLTISGKVICSNPSSPWAIKSMKYLDAKNKPQSVSNKRARHSVTLVPVNTSTRNRT
ncbi:monocyte chemotactic protein 1B-like [Sinocyclocheilus rhinocerous]|uniref:monocyte chemotactic protein 1B-like n=1 Tax=Sinocyclocheilus rhinocerous TaxID=307959 RepID=UPI0007BA1DE5|nr:PREDICTED: monocyte chemotactic protein 1B-like [Sinocyclocheilus rhinocerous]